MAHPDDYEVGLRGVFGLYFGEVTDNRDPERRGRVRIKVPGLIEPQSDWAFVAMPGQGVPRRGLFLPPGIGAIVVVGFIQGDVEEPIILGGIVSPDAATQAPYAGLSAEETPNQLSICLGRFAIVINGNDSEPSLKIYDEGVSTGASSPAEPVSYVILNGLLRSLSLKGQVAVEVKSAGLVQISGTRVIVQDRVVLINGQTV